MSILLKEIYSLLTHTHIWRPMWDMTVSPVTGINESNKIQAEWNGNKL